MSLIKSEDNKKWINFFVAFCCVILIFVSVKFLAQLGEWFTLEAKIPHFLMLTNAFGVVAGVLAFIMVLKNNSSNKFLNEVFSELVKVVWPSHDAVVKVTIGIVIGVSILSTLFVSVDGLTRKLFSFIY